LLTVLALLVVSIVINFVPSIAKQFPVKKGLDLAGGTRAVLQMQPGPNTPPINSDTQSQVVQVMTKRVNPGGVSEAVVTSKGSDQIIIEMPQQPGMSLEAQRQELHELIQPANLEFIWLRDVKTLGQDAGGDATARYIYQGGNSIKDGDTNKNLTPEQIKKDILYVDKDGDGKPDNVIVTGADLKPNGARVDIQGGPNGGVETLLTFDDKGAKAFADYTTEHTGSLLAIVLNGNITQAPKIKDAITDGTATISGGTTTIEEAKKLADLLNAGALPIPLTELSSTSVEATLGQNALSHAIVGGAIGIVLVMLFMIGYYFLPGFVAAIALIIYAALTFTVFRLLHITLTLPGIAGFILSIGMAVDANILIFERMKEEMQAGRTLHAAVDAGFDRAWTSIRDSNIATLITCAVLYGFGTGQIQGFALVLALGVLVSLFTAVTVSRALLHVFVNQPAWQKPSYFRVGGFAWGNRAGRQHWNIMGRKKLWYTVSILMILGGWFFNGLHYATHGTLVTQGIDFTGGSMLTYSIPAGANASDAAVKTVFSQNGLSDTSIQRIGAQTVGKDQASQVITVRAKEVTDQQVTTLLGAMQKAFGKDVTQQAVEKIGPVISKELTRKAVLAIAVALVLILLYLGYAFGQDGFADGLRYGLACTISMLHDVIILFGFMGFAGYFFHWELNSLFVTAALTIIGFTNHDTIVVFDRIRENMKLHGKEMTFTNIANMSVVQTLGRSINTSVTVVITLAALAAFGTAGSLDLRVFTIVLLVGVIFGTYSSIFFASPLLDGFEMRKRKQLATAARRPAPAADTKTFVTSKEPAAVTSTAPEPEADATDTERPASKWGDAAARQKPAGTAKKTKRRF
jgi:SecD/SecF fusion protein